MINPAYTGKAPYNRHEAVPRKKQTKQAHLPGRNRIPKKVNSSQRLRPKDQWVYIDIPSIIDQNDFDIAQEQLELNKKLSPRNNKKNDYLLSGLMRCQECDYSLYGVVSQNKKHSRSKLLYYRCMGQDGWRWDGQKKCSCHPVRTEVIEDLVWEQVKKLLEGPELVFVEYKNRIDEQSKNQEEYKLLLDGKNRELRALQHEKNRMLDLYQTGALTMKEIEKRLASIRQKTKNIESK